MIGDVMEQQRGGSGPGIRHVMFDADGVLQDLPGGWVAAAEPYFGIRAIEFPQRAYDTQLPTLAGLGDQLANLTAVLAEFGVAAPARGHLPAHLARHGAGHGTAACRGASSQRPDPATVTTVPQ